MSISITGVIIAILIAVLIWWLLSMIPMTLRMRQIITAIFIVLAIIWLLGAAGVNTGVNITR